MQCQSHPTVMFGKPVDTTISSVILFGKEMLMFQAVVINASYEYDRGCEDGFLKNCGECFIGKKDIADHHRETNRHHFDKLPDQSVIVIDNAKYHSRQTEDSKKPTTGWRKAKIQEWLLERGVSFDSNDRIPILLMKSKSVFALKKFNWRILRKDIVEGRKKISKFCAYRWDIQS